MTTLYNDTDPKAAAWLRELVSGGHITKGPVNERSISDLDPDDLRYFQRVHLFAGIGGWDYALRLAGWPDDRPVWTGSCPCQPFSAAGKGKGSKDERHLWPEMFRLIRECRPGVIFGEQVASAVGHGWLDGVFGDLEGEGYACGAVVLGAHSVGAPHIRQRLYWVADAQLDARGTRGIANQSREGDGTTGWRAHAQPRRCGDFGGLGHAKLHGPFTAWESGEPSQEGRVCESQGSNGWSRYDLIPCRDGKSRRVESGSQPLVAGIPRGVVPSGDPSVAEVQATAEARTMRLRGYGNSIVPQAAAEFVMAFMDTESNK